MERSILGLVAAAALFQIVICLNIKNPEDTSKRTFTKMVQLGDSVTLKCVEQLDSAKGEHFASNAVKWHKTQAKDEIETPTSGLEIASLSSLSAGSEFKKSGRFSVGFTQESDSVSVPMTITDVREEDSGWYTCFASTDVQTFSIRYELQVYVAPSSVVLSGKPNAEFNDSSVSGPLLFYSTEDGMLRCTAVNANPPPTIRMTIEGEDRPLTGHGEPQIDYALEGPIPGMQKILSNTSITINALRIRADQNGKRVHCVASGASGQQHEDRVPISTSRVLSVLYPPKVIMCSKDWKANVNDVNIKFGCTFEANPVPNVLWKSLDRIPVDIYPDGKIVDSLYSAQVMATTMRTTGNISIFQTDLHLVRVTENSYHRYKLELTNELGTVSKQFVLNPGEAKKETVRDTSGASIMTSSSIVICIITLAAAFFRQ